MKRDWANLPQEIVLHIFQYLYQDPQYEYLFEYQKQLQQYQEQLQCLQFINRNWGRAARRALYEFILLDGSENQVAVLLQTLESPENNMLSQAVRKILFREQAFPGERTLRALLKTCPNVTEIFTPYACNKLSYYYPLLSELQKEGYLQRLGKVAAPDTTGYKTDQSLIIKYHDAMLSLAATVTELHIYSKSEVVGGSTGLFSTVANHLADFASLKKLSIYVSHEIPFSEVGNLFVGNQPPQLNSFDLVSDSMTPSVTYPANNTTCELSQVERVMLQLNVLSAQDLCYIMRMFSNLKELTIEAHDQIAYFPQVNDSTSTLTFKRFSEYISRIPELFIQSLVMSPEVLLESVASLAEFNKLTVVQIRLAYIGVVDEVDLKVTRSMNKKYTCDDQDKTPCNVEMFLEFEAGYHLRLVRALLACTAIDCLSIEAEQEMLDHSEKTVKYGACLDYILSHCITLRKLSLECLDIDFSSSDVTINPSDKRDLSYLGLQGCRVSLDAYSYMSQRISGVGVFEFSESARDGEDDSEFQAVQIDMHYIVFDTFIYATKWHDFVVKIRSYNKTVIFRVSNEKKIQILDDSSPYTCNFASNARNFHTLTICCFNMGAFSVKGGEESIKV